MRIYVLILLTFFCSILFAQGIDVTFNHDASKMNQFLVDELGAGDLQPMVYYNLFHSGYAKTAIGTGKLTYRTTVMAEGMMQSPMADSIKTLLENRAKVEALNMADRQPLLDLEWAIEGPKIKRAFSEFEKNIGRIKALGNSSYQEVFKDKYNCFNMAISAAQDAYMPNSERKQVYLNIYKDIMEANNLCVKFISWLDAKKRIEKLASYNTRYKSKYNTENISTQAFGRWTDALSIATSGSSSSEILSIP